jgi:hypothetical protein
MPPRYAITLVSKSMLGVKGFGAAFSAINRLISTANGSRLPEQDVAALRGLNWRRSNSLESG